MNSTVIKNGVPGSQVYFTIGLRNKNTGKLADDDNWSQNNTLPLVRVYDPDNILIYDSEVLTNPQSVVSRESQGKYNFKFLIPNGSQITGTSKEIKFRVEWHFTINGNTDICEDYFNTSTDLKCCFNEDNRIGFMFNNPDLDSDYYYPSWGRLITPDEIRYGLFFGNDLAASNGDFFTDSMIQWYIDNALRALEVDLEIDITPRIYRHTPYPNFSNNVENERIDIPASEDNVLTDPYDLVDREFQKFVYIRLRQRPIQKLLKCTMTDLNGSEILNLLDGIKINYETGSLEFYPKTSMFANFNFFAPAYGNSRGGNYNSLSGFERLPDYFLIDYISGYKNVKSVPQELRQACFNICAWNILNDVGDGRSAALASSSISLAGISESFATTQSATSALYGARLESIQKWLKYFYERTRTKYSGILIGAL